MLHRWPGLGLMAVGALLSGGCDAVLGLGDIEIPGPVGAAGWGGTGASGGAPAGGAGGTGGAAAVCGDGMISGGEQCDDGKLLPGDGCGLDCMIEAGWACSGEPSVCAQTCGDGTLDGLELCDDGNVDVGDGCNQGCQVEAGWECDGEPSACHLSCGDGTLDGGEGCDDGGTATGDGCDGLCKPEKGYACEQPGGDPSLASVCLTICGDGIVVGAEVCDDGDTDDANGCKADCLGTNPGWECDPAGGGGSCTTTCGDGIPAGDEQCDDGNTNAYDGCGAQCTLEKTCNNGIVEPGEPCDDGVGCTMCMLDPMSVCGKALVIPSGVLDPATGVFTSSFEGDNSVAGSTVLNTDVAPQSCHGFSNAALHTYTTGKAPSLVTLHTPPMLADGTNTYSNTVLWAYRDCPNKRDLEGCNADSDPGGNYSLFTTGILPPSTTLYIVIAGDGGNDKGKYRIEVTERPVKLFFHESFSVDPAAGIYPPPASLTLQVEAAGADWVTCINSPAFPCTSITIASHSGGGFGIGHIPTGMADPVTSTVGLATPQVDLSGLTVARVQYDYRFNDGSGSDSGEVVPYDDATPDLGSAATYTTNGTGRASVPLPLTTKASAAFVYDDGASSAAGRFAIDDIYIYGY